MTKKVQKKKMKKQMGSFFIKIGKVLTSEEYTKLGRSQPVVGSSIKRIYGSYARMLTEITSDEVLMALVAQSAEIQKPTPKPKAKPKAKPAPKFGASKAEK